MSQKLWSLEDKLAQSKNFQSKLCERHEQARFDIAKLQDDTKDNGQNTEAATLSEAELDLKDQGIADRERPKRQQCIAVNEWVLLPPSVLGATWRAGSSAGAAAVIVNNTPSARAYFQRLRTPAHASPNFIVWLKTTARNCHLCALKKSFGVIAICIHRLRGPACTTRTFQTQETHTILNSNQQPQIPLHLRVSPIRSSSSKKRSSRALVLNLIHLTYHSGLAEKGPKREEMWQSW